MANKSADPSFTAMNVTRFVKQCKESLLSVDTDAAHYFEMIEDHLRSGGSLPTDQRGVEFILGL